VKAATDPNLREKLQAGEPEVILTKLDPHLPPEAKFVNFLSEAREELADNATPLQRLQLAQSELLPLVADDFQSMCKCCTSRFYDQIAIMIQAGKSCNEISEWLKANGENTSRESVRTHKNLHIKSSEAIRRAFYYLNSGNISPHKMLAGMIRDLEQKFREVNDPVSLKQLGNELRETIALYHKLDQEPAPASHTSVYVDQRSSRPDPADQAVMLEELRDIRAVLDGVRRGDIEVYDPDPDPDPDPASVSAGGAAPPVEFAPEPPDSGEELPAGSHQLAADALGGPGGAGDRQIEIPGGPKPPAPRAENPPIGLEPPPQPAPPPDPIPVPAPDPPPDPAPDPLATFQQRLKRPRPGRPGS